MLTVSRVCCRSTVNDTEMDLTDLAADVRSFVQEYRRGQRDTKRLVSHEGLETRKHVSTAIQGTRETIENVGQDVGKLAVRVDVQVSQAKRDRLLQSLRYPGFNERRNEVREAHPETFHWVFAGDDETSAATNSEMGAVKWDSFSNWLKSTDTVYWINGKPGCGKSTMVKYILADPQIEATKQCLDVWSPGCLIISHYFWRPGNPMQRSIKGLFCSLLYQLLENSESAIARVLALTLGPSMKNDVTDWSLGELQSTLRTTVEAYDRSICMFLDGLDEVYPDEPTNLLEVIRGFSITGKTKMCLASRPEPPLQRRLYDMPQLRLQDLTAADLTHFVHDHIQASKFDDSFTYENFVSSLVERAQGVFLWLVLITKSVRNGFDNGDDIGIIKERVDSLKGGDLESLYKDMWDRASRDNPDTYRRTAALYFRMMLVYNREGNEGLHIYGKNLSVFTMMFATTGLSEKTLDAATQPLDLVPEGVLLERCKEVERISETYCFGLVEVSEQNDDRIYEDIIGWYGGNYDKLLAYAQVRRALVFIHRTAVDFLMDTAQGKEILSFDDTIESFHAFQLVAANLAHAQLFCDFNTESMLERLRWSRSSWPSIWPSMAVTHLQSIDSIRKVYTDVYESATADYTRMMMHFKRLCDFEKVFGGENCLVPSLCSGAEFFKQVARHSCDCLDVFEDQIKALDKETLSAILQILCCLFGYVKGVDPRDCPDFSLGDMDVPRFINLVLLAGADPNWNPNTALGEPVLGTSELVLSETPFSEFISEILRLHLWKHCTKLLVTLQTFIRCGANLDEKITIFFTTMAFPDDKSEGTYGCLEYYYLIPDKIATQLGGSSGNKYGYICSVPAHDVLTLLLSRWELLPGVSNEGQVLADVKSSVACHTFRRSRESGSVLARLDIFSPRENLEWRWGVAPQEHQDQIAKELMSLMTLQKYGINSILQIRPSLETQEIGYETLISMLCGPHWVETVLENYDAFWNRLIDSGLFANPALKDLEFRTIEECLELKGILHASSSGEYRF